MQATEYILQPRPPVRAFLMSAAISLIATVLILVARSLEWHIAFTIGFAVLLALGIGLAGLGVASMKKRQVFVYFDDEGYRIAGHGRERTGDWAEVTRVTESADGYHVTIYHHGDPYTHLLCPSGTGNAQFQAMLRDMSQRLNRAYGYGLGL